MFLNNIRKVALLPVKQFNYLGRVIQPLTCTSLEFFDACTPLVQTYWPMTNSIPACLWPAMANDRAKLMKRGAITSFAMPQLIEAAQNSFKEGEGMLKLHSRGRCCNSPQAQDIMDYILTFIQKLYVLLKEGICKVLKLLLIVPWQFAQKNLRIEHLLLHWQRTLCLLRDTLARK